MENELKKKKSEQQQLVYWKKSVVSRDWTITRLKKGRHAVKKCEPQEGGR